MEVLSVVSEAPDRFSGGAVFHQRVIEALRGAGGGVREVVVRGEGTDARDHALRVLQDADSDCRVVASAEVVPSFVYALPMHQKRLRIVATFHRPAHAAPSLTEEERGRVEAAERSAYPRLDRVLTTSLRGAMALGPLGVLPDQIGLVLPAADPTPAATGTSDGMSLLTIGRVVRGKGLLELIDMVEGSPFSLKIVGSLRHDPEYAEEVAERAQRSDARVSVEGPLAPGELRAARDRADLYVSAGSDEAGGFAALEAIAAGLPVLAVQSGGLRKTLPSGGTVWVPKVAALAPALETWLTDRSARAALIQSAHTARGKVRRWPAAAQEVIREVNISDRLNKRDPA